MSKPITAGSEAALLLEERVGAVHDRVREVLEAAGLLPEALSPDAANQSIATQAATQAVSTGINQGLSTADVQANFGEALRAGLRNRLIQTTLEEELDGLFDDIDLSEPITAGSEAALLLEERLGGVNDRVREVLAAAGLLPDVLDEAARATENIATQAATQSITTGINQGLSTADVQANFGEALRAGLRNRLIQTTLEEELDGLFDDIDLSMPITAGSEAALLLEERLGGVHDRVLDVLAAAGLLPEVLEAPASLFVGDVGRHSRRVAQLRQLEAVGGRPAGAGLEADLAFARREAAALGGVGSSVAELQHATSLLDNLSTLTVEYFQNSIQQEQQRLNEQLQLQSAYEATANTLDQQVQSLLSAPGGLSGTQQLAGLERREAALRQELANAEGADRARILQELGQVLGDQVRLNAFGEGDARQEALFRSRLAEIEDLRIEADRLGRAAGTEAARLESGIEQMREDVVAELMRLHDLSDRYYTASLRAMEEENNRNRRRPRPDMPDEPQPDMPDEPQPEPPRDPALGQIEALRENTTALENLTATLTPLGMGLEELNTNLPELVTQLTPLGPGLEGLNTNLPELVTQLTPLGPGLEGLGTNLPGLVGGLGNLQVATADNTGALGGLVTHLTPLGTGLEDLNTQLTGLVTRLGDIQAAPRVLNLNIAGNIDIPDSLESLLTNGVGEELADSVRDILRDELLPGTEIRQTIKEIVRETI